MLHDTEMPVRETINALVGKTLTNVVGGQRGDDRITFIVNDGTRYQMMHYQDCCETVQVEEIIGDLSDLVGSPILQAEEVSSEDAPTPAGYVESHTWTFYKLATIKGSVTIRWLGESNGFYSESVDFIRLAA